MKWLSTFLLGRPTYGVCFALFSFLFLLETPTGYGQVGKGDVLGVGSIPVGSTVGVSDSVGINSLPPCSAASISCLNSLPLDLLDFTGRRLNELFVQLHWRTANEEDNSGFWVERSFGHPGDFRPVFFVPALHTPDLLKDYAVPDTNNYSGKTFYRLRVMDLDGNGTYSKEIEVDGYSADGVFKVYPNPGSGVFFLQLPASPGSVTTDIQVFNAWGQVVFHTVLSGQPGVAQLNLGRLSNGQYVVECRPINGQPAHARIILLK